MPASFTIRSAQSTDAGLILNFIKSLAEYEKLSHEVTATEEDLRQNLFQNRYAEVVIGYHKDNEDSEEGKFPAGFALFFHNFSTFVGKPGLYLEDLYVHKEYRGLGYGKKLLTHLATVAKERECGRYEWVVLDWNEPSIKFYHSLGAKPQKQWIIQRVDGKALDDLANM
ncbi:unnamed protein product [Umbelopsis sp. WA50703]